MLRLRWLNRVIAQIKLMMMSMYMTVYFLEISK
nr:MAG TPA: hypothetical protein [Caudoviricetes sp.]